ncbi:Oligopeptide transport ATP-binding protein OppF [Pseudovibrio axinellae]|uniref:Oligopeptide transport ATP-binding protein OppF n=1 Tax=Pseudovibrio axinellae TaxID=989403 RepID=A0A165SYU2_9HYPH|nr:dipeptide/oligopeptide/nickel ABC transporter ATP-binding protein [Pseudovibrio axinellae]KZL05038.1 Oligopeptide transport ATP-binding protein OppF [Pseudovibrio axinellae]SER65612.1 peptide/nickel transport system ATP-binding protein [Pseudovibrio axinellae]
MSDLTLERSSQTGDLSNAALFSIRKLSVSYPDYAHKPLLRVAPRIEILKGVSFDLKAGCITGLVGESGSGKTTLGRALVRLLKPDSGEILYNSVNIAQMDQRDLRPIRRDLQMIFQDPMSSLNPRHPVWKIIALPMRRYGLGGTRKDALEALEHVKLGAAFADRYPHELSGGQRQRVGIARAIAVKPKFILADEIVSGLDVSSQAKVLMLLQELKREMNLTVAFISHDLSVIRHLCDDLVVLNHGEIVDMGPVHNVFDQPSSQVTKRLIKAIPLPRIDESWFDEIV